MRVDCAHDAMVPVGELRANPRNPNRHPQAQLDLLATILSHCWRNPIVVSRRSGLIVKGHARLEAARLAGIAEAPVDYQDYDSEAEELADLVADNRIAELAERYMPDVRLIMEEIDTGELNMDLTGFDADALESLMTWTSEPVTVTAVKTDPPPPALTWVLVGIPTVRYGELAEYVEKAAAIDGAIVEISSSPGVPG